MSVSRTLAPGDLFRARVILMLADGRSYSEIQRRLGTTAPTIARWKKRFTESGVGGLMQRQWGARKPTVMTPELREQVITATCRRPADGSARWSCRALARELGLSKDIVQRIWRTEGLRPHRLERFMASDEKALPMAAVDVVGLYLRPTQHAAIFYCLEEPASLAAGSTRTAATELRVTALSDGRPQGRLSLYLALSGASVRVKTGKAARPAKDECFSFLSRVLDEHRVGLPLTIILDRLNRHEVASVELLLKEHPNAVLLLAPSYSAWLDRMEEWCSVGEDGPDPLGTGSSLTKLTHKLMWHIRAYSKTKKAIQWIYSSGPDLSLH